MVVWKECHGEKKLNQKDKNTQQLALVRPTLGTLQGLGFPESRTDQSQPLLPASYQEAGLDTTEYRFLLLLSQKGLHNLLITRSKCVCRQLLETNPPIFGMNQERKILKLRRKHPVGLEMIECLLVGEIVAV